MPSIFIGIPTVRNYQPFWDSLLNFTSSLNREYEIFKVENHPIAEARNIIVDKFLESDKDLLLFLDDDHSGHTIEMLESILDPILNNNAQVCGIRCYTKAFPYFSNVSIIHGMDISHLKLGEGQGKYLPIDIDKGFIYCDLIGFGMTIITRGIFSKLNKPYFVSQDNTKEDNYFCDSLLKLGIQPVACFDHTLEHMGIGKHNALTLREEGFSKLKEKYPDMKVLVS